MPSDYNARRKLPKRATTGHGTGFGKKQSGLNDAPSKYNQTRMNWPPICDGREVGMGGGGGGGGRYILTLGGKQIKATNAASQRIY